MIDQLLALIDYFQFAHDLLDEQKLELALQILILLIDQFEGIHNFDHLMQILLDSQVYPISYKMNDLEQRIFINVKTLVKLQSMYSTWLTPNSC